MYVEMFTVVFFCNVKLEIPLAYNSGGVIKSQSIKHLMECN